MSNNDPQVLAYHLTRSGGERLRQLVAGAPKATLLGMESAAEEFERKALQLQPEVLLVEFDPDETGISELLGRLRRGAPRASLVAWAHNLSSEAILLAMRLGVREYLPSQADGAAFAEALQRLLASTAQGDQQGTLLGVMGVKGGVGASSLALSLAWVASQSLGARVAMLDLDLAGGDLASLLDIEPTRSMVHVAEEFERLDSLLMDSLMVDAAPGLRLLASPGDAVAAEEIKGAHVEKALDLALAEYALVVVDLPSRVDEASLAALDRAKLLLLVTEPTVLGLKAAQRSLELCRNLGREKDEVALVVNRHGAKQCLPAKEVARVLKLDPLAVLPNDSQVLMAAANAGRPPVRDWPRSKWSKSVATLAKELFSGNGDGK
ncbi:MAG: P-loop NTPase [Desulfarculaceae bacterium]|nr:P-loop NTPase [Desulfarculaceae bacterium]MCF8047327.1 P-loop NTPase [Desulfarculaceae bacterium]MCF8063876.1 P-loop NTPase [Desulfarculaceae bacterium]MCF8096554.1 P-loop NTPase [Desulfarculaceae bacterium]MCF8122110.1 P-loop NTPase [Desulfarculaceae bacterium]